MKAQESYDSSWRVTARPQRLALLLWSLLFYKRTRLRLTYSLPLTDQGRFPSFVSCPPTDLCSPFRVCLLQAPEFPNDKHPYTPLRALSDPPSVVHEAASVTHFARFVQGDCTFVYHLSAVRHPPFPVPQSASMHGLKLLSSQVDSMTQTLLAPGASSPPLYDPPVTLPGPPWAWFELG